MTNYSIFPLVFPFVFTSAHGKPIPRGVHTALDKQTGHKAQLYSNTGQRIKIDQSGHKGII